jgi:hypothetical protein
MKAQSRNRWTVVAGLAIGLSTSPVRAACNAGSLNGDFWFIGNGTVQQTPSGGNVKFTPFVEIGRVSYDGKGGASLIETVALHSGQSEVQAKGSYVVSADCRGSVEWKVSGGGYLQSYAILILQGGSEIETVAFRTAASGGSRPLSTFSQKKF